MFSSVVSGIRALEPRNEAFFLLPADIPLVRGHTISVLCRAYKRAGVDVVYPVFQGRRGHPPLISARLIPAILAWNRPEGLRLLLEQYAEKASEAAVLDEGILLDTDTPVDYHRIIERCRHRDIPSQNECDALLAKMSVPDIVVKHSRVVSGVARRLADCLNRAGLKLDAGLVEAAGLLHDLAKGKPDHARCGARLLKSLGYPKVAGIVAVHTDIAFEEGFPLDEAAVVYLADKLVKQDSIVSINERFQWSMEKYANDPAVLPAIAERWAKAHCIGEKIEQILGNDLATVVSP